ncbi:hypothetical protein [Chromobacterium amazonense]|uniref:Uncharacterized protein n=1 Tax=Chromobacterium amazonense TaxID=1382803 RepID=A0ABU8V368_9NEIS|nr:hypothetical protein [Chromobacterium amazonense]MDQ4540019.1 hypothetical protein [Chromobacterium amazonense]
MKIADHKRCNTMETINGGSIWLGDIFKKNKKIRAGIFILHLKKQHGGLNSRHAVQTKAQANF